MKTLAILSRKGGTGKTTLATHLSVAAERAGHTAALIDLDPQSSAAKWRDNRTDETPAVISAHSQRLGHRIGFVHAYNAGLTVQESEPASKATTEINALYTYIAEQMGV